jgi:phospholipid/cholesterol/gamma-HCH transport system ATP-binding protein
MEIGENVIFISEGAVIWTGNCEEILKADNKTLQDFVFASELMKKIKG